MSIHASPMEARHVKVGDVISRGGADGLWGPVTRIEHVGRQLQFWDERGGVIYRAPRKVVHVVDRPGERP